MDDALEFAFEVEYDEAVVLGIADENLVFGNIESGRGVEAVRNALVVCEFLDSEFVFVVFVEDDYPAVGAVCDIDIFVAVNENVAGVVNRGGYTLAGRLIDFEINETHIDGVDFDFGGISVRRCHIKTVNRVGIGEI